MSGFEMPGFEASGFRFNTSLTDRSYPVSAWQSNQLESLLGFTKQVLSGHVRFGQELGEW